MIWIYQTVRYILSENGHISFLFTSFLFALNAIKKKKISIKNKCFFFFPSICRFGTTFYRKIKYNMKLTFLIELLLILIIIAFAASKPIDSANGNYFWLTIPDLSHKPKSFWNGKSLNIFTGIMLIFVLFVSFYFI